MVSFGRNSISTGILDFKERVEYRRAHFQKEKQHGTTGEGDASDFLCPASDVAVLGCDHDRGAARCSDEWRMAPDRWRRRQHEILAAGPNQRPECQEPQGCVDMEG